MRSLKKHPCCQNNPLVPFSPNTKGKRRPALQRHRLRWEWRLQRYSPGKRRQTSLLFSLSEQVPLRQPHKPKPSARKIFSGSLPGKRLCLSPSRQLAEIPRRQKVPGRIRPSNLLRYHLCLTCRTAHLNFLLH